MNYFISLLYVMKKNHFSYTVHFSSAFNICGKGRFYDIGCVFWCFIHVMLCHSWMRGKIACRIGSRERSSGEFL